MKLTLKGSAIKRYIKTTLLIYSAMRSSCMNVLTMYV